MTGPLPFRAALAAAGVGALLLAGCVQQHAYVVSGNASKVEVGYGSDVAEALPLARKHCAEYDKVPRLTLAGANLADYDCVPR